MKSSSKRRRIGIFGGTFDPPHVGHLMIAEQARVQLRLDTVYFVPAYRPPHKTKMSGSGPPSRKSMVRLSIRGHRGFAFSDIELQRKGISYTIDTVHEFRMKFPSADIFLILGEDNMRDFSSWKNPREIRTLATLAVYRRVGYHAFGRRSGVVAIKGPEIDISSTEIRKMVRQRMSIRYLVLPAVERFIARNRLYR